MYELTQGNVFECGADAVVNTVNCVGVMGRGIALQCKRLYPGNFKAYEAACRRGEVVPGRMFVHETGLLTPPRFIINFPTKRHWRNPSRIEDVEAGLQDLAKVLRMLPIRSLAVPPLGCGLGGLDWRRVEPMIRATLQEFPEIDSHVFAPEAVPVSHEVVPQAEPRMTAGRAALITLVADYLKVGLDPFITLLETQKLMYFLQVAGEPLRLEFSKGFYGPYARALGHVLQALNGHLIVGYSDGGDAPGKPLELLPGAEEKARQFLQDRPETESRLQRVLRLIFGFETPTGMELLATVHWLYAQDGRTRVEDIIDGVAAWNARKQRMFQPGMIRNAYDRLMEQGWIA